MIVPLLLDATYSGDKAKHLESPEWPYRVTFNIIIFEWCFHKLFLFPKAPPFLYKPPLMSVPDSHIFDLVMAREVVRFAKNYKEADRIRIELKTFGVIVDDKARTVRMSDGRVLPRPDAPERANERTMTHGSGIPNPAQLDQQVDQIMAAAMGAGQIPPNGGGYMSPDFVNGNGYPPQQQAPQQYGGYQQQSPPPQFGGYPPPQQQQQHQQQQQQANVNSALMEENRKLKAQSRADERRKMVKPGVAQHETRGV